MCGRVRELVCLTESKSRPHWSVHMSYILTTFKGQLSFGGLSRYPFLLGWRLIWAFFIIVEDLSYFLRQEWKWWIVPSIFHFLYQLASHECVFFSITLPTSEFHTAKTSVWILYDENSRNLCTQSMTIALQFQNRKSFLLSSFCRSTGGYQKNIKKILGDRRKAITLEKSFIQHDGKWNVRNREWSVSI